MMDLVIFAAQNTGLQDWEGKALSCIVLLVDEANLTDFARRRD